MKKKLALLTGALFLSGLMGVLVAAPNAHAKSKVDCDAVMSELNGGKKVKEVAKDLHISKSSVYRCRKKAKKAAAKAGSEAGSASSAPAVSVSPEAPAKP